MTTDIARPPLHGTVYNAAWADAIALDRERNAEPMVAPGTCPFCEGEAHARACQPLRTLLMDDEINVLSLIESLDDARDTIELLSAA